MSIFARNPLTLYKYFAEVRPDCMKAYVFLIAAFLLCACSSDRYVSFSGYAQGGVWTVKANLKGANCPREEIASHIEALLEDIDFSLSGYNKGSLLSRLNSGERIVPDSLLIRAYDESYRYYLASGAAFDIAAAPLYDAWGFGFSSGQMPSDSEVTALLSCSSSSRLVPRMEDALGADGSLCAEDLLRCKHGADPSQTGLRAEEQSPGPVAPKLNFNAIAQGLTSDIIAEYLRSVGIRDMLVDIGEIYCCGLNPSGKPWTIGIDAPIDGNDTPGEHLQGIWNSGGLPLGIVTSGNYRKFYVRDGKKYAHTIDPRSGYPVSHSLLSATVVAPSATRADALATACMVLGPDRGRELILSDPELEACFIMDADSVWTSPGFLLR